MNVKERKKKAFGELIKKKETNINKINNEDIKRCKKDTK